MTMPTERSTAFDEADLEAYNALYHNAAWFDSPGRLSRISGPKAMEALNGLVTNDLAQLPVDGALYALALTPKGKMVTDMLIARTEEHAFLVLTPAIASDAWLALARKYINPRLATVTDETDRLTSWMLFGPRAVDAVGSDGSQRFAIGAASARLIRAPLLGALPGFVIVADTQNAEATLRALETSGCPHAGHEVWTIARVEAGQPAMGDDMDESTIPQEANLDDLGAISFTKGCYTGQETVARVHFRGHVNRHLRGLRATAPLTPGSPILDQSGKEVGDVRTAVNSPRLGPIALAMVRREVAIGAAVAAGGVESVVEALPFERGDTL